MKNLLLILPFLLILSCSVQKRKYQKGYYVNWHQSHGSSRDKKESIAKSAPAKELTAQEVTAPSIADPEIVVSVNDDIRKTVLKKKKTPLIGDEPCDDIIFKDGSEIKGKIVEITPTEIKYKKCDMLDGPNYVTKKSEVFMIKYSNGTREVFKDQPNNNSQPGAGQPNNNVQRSLHDLATVSFVLGILSLIPFITSPFFAVAAIVKGDRALKEIHAQPHLYRGEGMATIGKIIGIIVSVFWLIVIVAFVILLLSL
ncbi:MAG: DUF4190 domain-containing protein [Bacteroidota bacterium]